MCIRKIFWEKIKKVQLDIRVRKINLKWRIIFYPDDNIDKVDIKNKNNCKWGIE